jgi:hypothetical protein
VLTESLHRCVPLPPTQRQGCTSVISVLVVERRVLLLTWLVDTSAQLSALANDAMHAPTHIISNSPLAVAPECAIPAPGSPPV